MSFDTIIVGAGSAGCVLANRLSADPVRRVLLLEAGRAAPLNSDIPANWPAMFNTNVDWGYHTEPQAGCRGRRIYWPRGKMVGGSGALNAMIYIRGLPSDYDGWAAEGCAGWGWQDVLPVFLKSESNLRLGNAPLHSAGGELTISDPAYVDPHEVLWHQAAQAAGFPNNTDFNSAVQEGVGWFQQTVKDGERFGTGKAYLRPALDRPNLTLRTGVTTTRILIENGRAKGVTILDRGVPETIYADEVVLSAGAIGSAQLLLLSGIGPADELAEVGVASVHNLPGVGKTLRDHINIPISFAARDKIGIGGMTGAELDAATEEWLATKQGPLSSIWVAAGGFVKTAPDVAEPDIQLYGVISGHRDHARYMASGPGITLHATLQRPKSNGELRLRSADPLEYPSLDPKYFSSDPSGYDLATMIAGVKLNRRIAAQSPLAELIAHEMTPSAEAVTDEAIGEFIRGQCTTLYHPTSTCRMGVDAGAVVDPKLRVHGIEGLRVADASVFPNMISGNTNAPTIMVAERAAIFMGAAPGLEKAAA
ncbi:GMC family oxidoreductase [Acidisoma silvae]|uniref:GMC family oxidoreductase N-terminal domain-containing protein n=1 Tax=Acidisoma silvae TaxID=2802396 RepID=A0A963YSR1_9PROT|nr:GMC family oxidoreductase N-terminal domain-containing protein [Acidisoma silvae]MCB8876379.1 GMC family oxidoreductase N-terminal domain-containing protein [Acidisoma silvae]